MNCTGTKKPLRTSFIVIGCRREIDNDGNGDLLATVIKQPLPTVTADAEIGTEVQAVADEGCRIYSVTFAVGHFVAQVLGHDFRARVKINTGAAPVQRVWPTSPRFDWPASRAVDDIGGVAGLHRSAMQQSVT